MGTMMALQGAGADDLWRALTGGKPDLYLRYRLENIDDGQQPVLKDAYANTLRSALGYNTGRYHAFGLYGQVDAVVDDGGPVRDLLGRHHSRRP
jgi:hypothetical protein